MLTLSIQKKKNKEVKYCLRPSQNRSIRLRIHHRGKLVETPVKWYVNGIFSEMNWKWDVDYMSYMQLEEMIGNEGYTNIKCLWYWNLRFGFNRDLRPINCDVDILKFIEDANGFELIYVYVEHTIVHDYAEEVHFNDEFSPNYDDEEVKADRVDDDVQVGSENVEDEVPLIILGACFLKGDYGGQLMAAVGMDGNNKIYHIAYVDLVQAVQSVSTHVEKRLCVKHLYGNWKKKYLGLELKEVMWSAARATTVVAWERAMLRMKGLNEAAWKEMKDIPTQH
ncbi:hypothetical protein KIW84_063676 [Lathyrus oleraceus]|uniref:PB1-like domain-containing protein n=1 Tax=Pisum sativum TaxID=3888 RepID=A0A9D4WAG5_PEA|nr:hypothetical protein KIW84_063676 [Pisum sativum]